MSFQLKKSVLALALVSATCMSSLAQAGGNMTVPAPAPLPGGSWYAGIFGGIAFTSDLSSSTVYGSNFGDYDFKNGYDVGGEFGYHVGPFRFEGEYAYLRTNLKDVHNNNGSLVAKGGVFHSRLTNQLIMANAFYDFSEISDNFGIYIGGGVGAANIRLRNELATPISGHPVHIGSVRNTEFAYQGIIGLSFNVDANFALSVDYRYIGASEPSKIFSERYATHTINGGIRYNFPA